MRSGCGCVDGSRHDAGRAGPVVAVAGQRLAGRSSRTVVRGTECWMFARVGWIGSARDRDTRVSYAARSNPSYRGSRPVVRSELSEAANTRLPGGSNAGGGPRDRRHRRTQHDREALAGSYSTMDRAAAAADRHASGDLLERLCADADRYVRLQVARNPACPPGVLGRMAAGSDVGVRAAVAGHKASSAELLVSLASDHSGGGERSVWPRIRRPRRGCWPVWSL